MRKESYEQNDLEASSSLCSRAKSNENTELVHSKQRERERQTERERERERSKEIVKEGSVKMNGLESGEGERSKRNEKTRSLRQKTSNERTIIRGRKILSESER